MVLFFSFSGVNEESCLSVRDLVQLCSAAGLSFFGRKKESVLDEIVRLFDSFGESRKKFRQG